MTLTTHQLKIWKNVCDDFSRPSVGSSRRGIGRGIGPGRPEVCPPGHHGPKRANSPHPARHLRNSLRDWPDRGPLGLAVIGSDSPGEQTPPRTADRLDVLATANDARSDEPEPGHRSGRPSCRESRSLRCVPAASDAACDVDPRSPGACPTGTTPTTHDAFAPIGSSPFTVGTPRRLRPTATQQGTGTKQVERVEARGSTATRQAPMEEWLPQGGPAWVSQVAHNPILKFFQN